jgi:hypothetical protein
MIPDLLDRALGGGVVLARAGHAFAGRRLPVGVRPLVRDAHARSPRWELMTTNKPRFSWEHLSSSLSLKMALGEA